MKLARKTSAVLLAVLAMVPALRAKDLREPFATEAAVLESAARLAWKEADRVVEPENIFRTHLIETLREMSLRSGMLLDAARSDETKNQAFRLLARVNELAGHLAADLPRSDPFEPVWPLHSKTQEALDALNEVAALYFGAPAPTPQTTALAREIALKATAMPDHTRNVMRHSGARHRLVRAFEEFAAEARRFNAGIGDPLVTEAGQHHRLRKLIWNADHVDALIVESRAAERVRSRWNGLHDSLRLLSARIGG